MQGRVRKPSGHMHAPSITVWSQEVPRILVLVDVSNVSRTDGDGQIRVSLCRGPVLPVESSVRGVTMTEVSVASDLTVNDS